MSERPTLHNVEREYESAAARLSHLYGNSLGPIETMLAYIDDPEEGPAARDHIQTMLASLRSGLSQISNEPSADRNRETAKRALEALANINDPYDATQYRQLKELLRPHSANYSVI